MQSSRYYQSGTTVKVCHNPTNEVQKTQWFKMLGGIILGLVEWKQGLGGWWEPISSKVLLGKHSILHRGNWGMEKLLVSQGLEEPW